MSNTTITFKFKEGYVCEYTVSDEVESKLYKGFTIKSCHPSVVEMFSIEAGETREDRAVRLVQDMYLKFESDHGRQPYKWHELNAVLMERIKEFI